MGIIRAWKTQKPNLRLNVANLRNGIFTKNCMGYSIHSIDDTAAYIFKTTMRPVTKRYSLCWSCCQMHTIRIDNTNSIDIDTGERKITNTKQNKKRDYESEQSIWELIDLK